MVHGMGTKLRQSIECITSFNLRYHWYPSSVVRPVQRTSKFKIAKLATLSGHISRTVGRSDLAPFLMDAEGSN